MSLLSRKTRGRRSARFAAVVAGSLTAWLTLTAVPASAVSTCTVDGGNPAILNVAIDTDDTLALAVSDGTASFGAVAAGTYAFTVLNPGTGLFPAFATCGAGATQAAITWVNVTGSNAGNERLILWRPAVAETENITVDLGNGNDSFTVDYGGFTSPPYAAAFADPAGLDYPDLGTSAAGLLVMDLDTLVAVTGDVRVDDAETVTINGGDGVDRFDAGNDWDIAADAGLAAPVTGDDIPAATAPWSAPLVVNGGNGDDTLDSGDGNDTFNGQAGTDTVTYSDPGTVAPDNGYTAAGPVVVDLAAGTGTGMGNDTFTDVQNVTGSEFGDTLTGNALDNVIDGADGNDVIDGAAGDDTLTGGADGPTDADAVGGNDTFLEGTGDNGADTVTGGDSGAAGDTVDLRGRTAALYVAPGVAASSGEGGCPLGAGCEGDTYATSNENYLLGSGADTFVGSGTGETVRPGAGDDTVGGGAGFDYLDLSDVAGPATFDMITGTATGNGTDTFTAVEGFIGTAGNDTVLSDDASGVPGDFIGGDGIDTVDASASTAGVVIALAAYTGAPPDVENAIGGSGPDTITGNVLNNSLWGNDGADVITAGAGNDFVEGGLGNDTLTDGGGADRLSYRNAPAGVDVDVVNGFAEGGDGSDTLAGGWEIVLGSNFNDTITGGQSSVDVPNRLKGFGGSDQLFGTNSTDVLAGGAGNDGLRGGGGDDILKGAAGDDLLLGSAGDDLLNGGRGEDTGNGGRGFDQCKVEHESKCEA